MPLSTDRFDALVAPHIPTLFRVAYRLVRNSHDAQDLVQDTCIAACEHPAELDAAEHPVRWLLRVLLNRFIDGARRKQRAPFVAHVHIKDYDGGAHHDGYTPRRLASQSKSAFEALGYRFGQ